MQASWDPSLAICSMQTGPWYGFPLGGSTINQSSFNRSSVSSDRGNGRTFGGKVKYEGAIPMSAGPNRNSIWLDPERDPVSNVSSWQAEQSYNPTPLTEQVQYVPWHGPWALPTRHHHPSSPFVENDCRSFSTMSRASSFAESPVEWQPHAAYWSGVNPGLNPGFGNGRLRDNTSHISSNGNRVVKRTPSQARQEADSLTPPKLTTPQQKQTHLAILAHVPAEKNLCLVNWRNAGMSYRDIKIRGNFAEAESTLRGRYRALTKHKHQRLRSPVWQTKDIALLDEVVRDFLRPGHPLCKDRIPWKKVAESILAKGGSYLFGPGTCKKKWEELVSDGIIAAGPKGARSRS